MTLVPPERTPFGDSDLIRHWDGPKNEEGGVLPWRVGINSTLFAWWKCVEGPDHEFRRVIHRSRKRGVWTGCPYCAGRLVSVTNCLATVAPQVAAQWHPKKNGKRTPKDIVSGSSEQVWRKCPKGPDHEWRGSVAGRTGGKRLGCPFCSNRRLSKTNSLAAISPRSSKEWHPTKNGKLRPKDVVPGSAKRVWWKCAKGHAWCVAVNARTALLSSGGEVRGCPLHQPHCHVQQ